MTLTVYTPMPWVREPTFPGYRLGVTSPLVGVSISPVRMQQNLILSYGWKIKKAWGF